MNPSSSAVPKGQELVVLESDVPISKSLIWQSQRDSYISRGIRSWTEDMVPHFITNNPFFAEIYARIVFGFVCDCLDSNAGNSKRITIESPLRILELGAGPGKFAFLFLRQIEALFQSKDISLNVLRYCMTDFSEGLVESWRANKYLSGFVERKILQFEQFDAAAPSTSGFLHGTGGLTAQNSGFSRGPLVVIANYVFDSLPHDAFTVKDGMLFELLQTTSAPNAPDGNPATESLSRLHFSYKSVDTAAAHYENSSWNNILDLYRSRLSDATILFPSQVLKTLQSIGNSTDGAMLVLAADKGLVSEAALSLSQAPPTLEFHSPNCFSQLVNFDSIAKYFQALGGQTFLPDKDSASLNVCAFLHDRLGRQFPFTQEEYLKARSAIGPDDLFTLLGWLHPHMEEMSAPQILSLLRLSRWDTATLMRVFPVLACHLRSASAERNDLREAVLRTWSNHFPVAPQDNVLSFQCGVVLLELRFFEEALAMFTQAQDLLGRSAPISYNLGLCAQALGHSTEALALMREAIQLDPAFEPAIRFLRESTASDAG